MSTNLKESETLQNLMRAFAGESQARNKYTYFAEKARKDGYNQIAEIFEEKKQRHIGTYVPSQQLADTSL